VPAARAAYDEVMDSPDPTRRRGEVPLSDLVDHREAVEASRSVAEVNDFFNGIPSDFAAVVDHGTVIGICGKSHLRGKLASRYGFALFNRAPISEHLLPDPLLVQADAPLRTLLELALVRQGDAFYEDVVLIDEDERLVGLVSTHRLVQAQSELMRQQFALLEDQQAQLEVTNRDLARGLEHQQDLERHIVAKEKAALVETLASGIAHELNNKLVPIVGYSELLLEEMAPFDNPALEESCRAIHAAALDSSRIIRQLLQLSRPTATERTSCDLRELVEQSLSLMALRLRETDTQLSVDLPATPIHVLADGGQLRQVVTNLVLNAMDAMERSSRRALSARVSLNAGSAALAISDTGTGIAPDTLSKIFDPFFTTKAPNRGTGLGLSVTQSIVRAHGGNIRVDSALGVGTTFTIVMPCEAAASPALAPRVVSPTPFRCESAHVLVVDDDDAVASVVVRILRTKLGCQVTRAEQGDAACALLAGADYDLLLSDVRMPELNGVDLLAWIRRHRPHMLRRLVFMTGDASESTLNAAIQQTGVPVLRKPLSMEGLVTHARAVIESRAADLVETMLEREPG
jgi:signal transduction histidine kinase/CheY-like chemotaxis protein